MRETIKKMKIFGVVAAVFILGFGLIGIGGAWKIFIPLLTGVFAFVGVILFISSYVQAQNYGKSLLFYIDETVIGQAMDKKNLNLANQLGAARSENYGTKFNQTITKKNLELIHIKQDEIVVKSKDFNVLTNNGRVCFPKELVGYDEAKKLLEQF